MTKRVLLITLALCLCLPLLVSCNPVPEYEEDFSYAPIIEYEGTKYRLDQLLAYQKSNNETKTDEGYPDCDWDPSTFDALESYVRNSVIMKIR